jgi:hypothetical protein
MTSMYKIVCTNRNDNYVDYEIEFQTLQEAKDKILKDMEADRIAGFTYYDYSLFEKSEWKEIPFRLEIVTKGE